MMSLTCDRNLITLSDIPNEHLMILGSSGYGKMYYCCQRMEEETSRKRKILVIDYSSSYDEKEREKNNLDNVKGVREFNPFENLYYFTLRERDEEKFKKDIADTIVKILGIRGYTQEELLHEGLKRHFESYRYLNFAEFFDTLREFMAEKRSLQEREDVNNLSKLLQKLRIYSDIKNINIMQSNVTGRKENLITII